jgi:hypothetical protein
MSYFPRLISNLRALFGCGRVLFFGAIVLYPFMLLLSIGSAPLALGEVFFRVPEVKLQRPLESGTRPPVFSHLRGDLSLPAITPEDRSFQRIVGFSSMLPLILGFLICHWMWRLCRNVENGEIFNAANLRLVRWVGIALVVDAIGGFIVEQWTTAYVAGYIQHYVSFSGLELIKGNSQFLWVKGMTFDVDQLITGLLVLCLAEVFRTGLELKRETDLTV